MTTAPAHATPLRNETSTEKYARHVRNAVVTIAVVAVMFAVSAIVAAIVFAVIAHDTSAASSSCPYITC